MDFDDPTELDVNLGKVLLLTHEEESMRLLHQALIGVSVVPTNSLADAYDILSAEKISVLVVDYDLPEEGAIELLEKCKTEQPHIRSLLWAPYKEVPNLVAVKAGRLAAAIVPKPGKARNIQKAVGELLAVGRSTIKLEHSQASSPEVSHWERVQALMKWTVARLTQVHDRVIRPFGQEKDNLVNQLVLPLGPSLERLKKDLREEWGEPIKQSGEELNSLYKEHPCMSYLGYLGKEQELYSLDQHSAQMTIYLALLPWKEQPYVTLIVGMVPKDIEAKHMDFMGELYERAMDDASMIQIPVEADDTIVPGQARILQSHDLVATESYVGKDRRRNTGAAFDRYAYRGKRSFVPQQIADLTITFTDRLSTSAKRYFVAYMLLSMIDTVCTFVFVRNGTVNELNPILAPLLEDHPWKFFAVKNMFAISAFLGIARFELIRIAKYGLPLLVALYLLLDLYWAALLLF